MRLIYPLLWSRLGRKADQEQSVSTAAAFGRAGAEITLVMPQGPSDPALDADALRAWFQVEGSFDLVQRRTRFRGVHFPMSALWYLEVARTGLVKGADILYSRMPAAFAAGGASPIPFAVEHYRLWPDRLPILRPAIRRTAQRRHCLGFILHSDFAARSYRRIGVPDEKLLVAHNGVDLARALPRRTPAEARAALGLPDGRPVALYAGRLAARKGLDRLLAMARLRPEIRFVLVGSEREGEIERAAAGLSNVDVRPWAAPDVLPLWLQAADVLLIPPSSAPLDRYGDCVLPMKTFAYLAAARPILAPASPDTAELLRDGETARLVPPDDPEAAAAALAALVADVGLRQRLGEGAAALAETLTWDRRAEKILGFLEAGMSRSRFRSG
jgi:glycosyltransferase involved in cell wall biosynthesis